jgi:hypothetical protein
VGGLVSGGAASLEGLPDVPVDVGRGSADAYRVGSLSSCEVVSLPGRAAPAGEWVLGDVG